MAEKLTDKKPLSEKALRIFRDLNLGAAVLWGAGAVLVPPAAPVFGALAAIDIAQAGGAEVVLRARKKRHQPAH